MSPGQKLRLTVQGIIALADLYPDAHLVRGRFVSKPERSDGQPVAPQIVVHVDGRPMAAGFYEGFWEADNEVATD